MKIKLGLTSTDPPEAYIYPDGFLGPGLFDKYRAALQKSAFAFYDPEEKAYRVPLDRLHVVVDALRAADFKVHGDARAIEAVRASRQAHQIAKIEAESRAHQADKQLKTRDLSLYPYQFLGIDFLASNASCLLADEMGLGKTVQAIMAVAKSAPLIIVCPALLKCNWEKEIHRFRADWDGMRATDEEFFLPDLQVHYGRQSFKQAPGHGQGAILNYDILPEPHVAENGYATWAGPPITPGTFLIVDEAHYVKNPAAKRTKAFRALSRAVREKGGATLGLTGTPLESQPQDLWGVLQAFGLGAQAFDDWPTFVKLMHGAQGQFGMVWGKPEPEVGSRLARVMLRRKRADVLQDLPEKRYKTVHVSLEEVDQALLKELYGEITTQEQLAIMDMLQSDELPTIDKMARARRVLADLKIDAMTSIIEEYVRANEPVLIFSAHRRPIDSLVHHGWATITGDTPTDEREAIVTRFQAGEIPVLGGTIGAMGVGVTLTRSAHALFVDRDFTPSRNQQAEDRIMRIGQTRGVLITDLVVDHPLDKHLLRVLKKKQGWIDESVEKAVRR